tara:strand:- start:4447 stop:6072 length:1626 start_codon:yes stop_codon:yes gene_type:complete
LSEEQIEDQAVSEENISLEKSQDEATKDDHSPPPDSASAGTPRIEEDFEDMESLLAAVDISSIRPLKRGETLTGTVMAVEREGILVDIGHKSEGFVPTSEMLLLGADPLSKLEISQEVTVSVVQAETAAGQVGLSMDKARGEQGWKILQDWHDNGEVFEAEITSFNKGGLLANVEGINAFIPMSQVVGAKPGSDGVAPLGSQVGKSLKLKVIEINRKRNRVILSERAANQEWRAEQKEKLLDELHPGDIRTGIITSIRPFGIFVDLGGADGLAHLSEISWDRNANPEEMFSIGQEIKVYILRIDQDTKKIALSVRRAAPEQWDDLITRYQIGDVVPSVITRLVNFGAFARLPGPVEGLIHVSSMVDRRISSPKEILDEGDVIPVKIEKIERDRHRLGLSLRDARDEALALGWQFDSLGRIIGFPDSVREELSEEATIAEQRFEQRKAENAAVEERASVDREARESRAASARIEREAATDRAPQQTAMEQAFAQASSVDQDAEEIEPDADIVESTSDIQEDLDNPVEEPSGETDQSDSDENT